MTVSVLESAARDVVAGHRFYDTQWKGLGDRLETHVYESIESLHLYAGTHVTVEAGFFKMNMPPFPYAVYYRIGGGSIIVHAVLDCRRNPTWTTHRLTKLRKNS